jgi:hypothetical protein
MSFETEQFYDFSQKFFLLWCLQARSFPFVVEPWKDPSMSFFSASSGIFVLKKYYVYQTSHTKQFIECCSYALQLMMELNLTLALENITYHGVIIKRVFAWTKKDRSILMCNLHSSVFH